MTVFVTQKPIPNNVGWKPDLSPAAEYGAIKFVFNSHERVFAHPQKYTKVARKQLADFNQDEDYICWPNSGDPSTLYIIHMVLWKYHDIDQINYLYWNRKRDDEGNIIKGKGFYHPLTIEV